MLSISKKIANKLAFGYLLIVLISLLFIGILFIQQFRNYYIDEKQKNMTLQAKQFAKTAAPGILEQSENSKLYIDLMSSFASAKVILINKEGRIEEFTNRGVNEKEKGGKRNDDKLEKALISGVLEGKDVRDEGYCFFLKEPHIIVGVPVYNNSGKIIGAVFLNAPIINITSVIDKALLILAILILAALILTGILGIIFSNFITKPIKLMNQSAIEMAGGNYSIRTNIVKKDEIGQLAGSLDMLASKLGYTLDQLFQEKSKLNDLFSSISEGILAFDSEMKLTNYNESLKMLFNLSWNDDIEKKVRDILNEKGVIEHLEKVIGDGQKRSLIVEHNKKKLKFIISPVKSNSDITIGVVSLIQDISESERLEQMRKDFIANISHELRTPLTLIRGSMETILDGVATDKEAIEKNYNRILRETSGMERLIGDLQDLSMLQSGRTGVNIDRVDITQLLIELSGSMQSVAQKKGIVIKTITDNDVPMVLGDYDRLKQLFVIFLDNSIKYSNDDTIIEISIGKDNKYVFIKITDNGIGIPGKDIQNIWERFYKVDKSRNKTNKGLGLGLSIARQIIEIHNGVVHIKSSIGVGTEIEIGLPY